MFASFMNFGMRRKKIKNKLCYWCYYRHTSRQSASPVTRDFFFIYVLVEGDCGALGMYFLCSEKAQIQVHETIRAISKNIMNLVCQYVNMTSYP